MNRLIEDLLDLTRIETGHLSVERSRLRAQQAVLDAAEAQKPLVSAAGLELRLEVVGDLPLVEADPQRLLQVFENLIGNAIKFTPSGGRITVGVAPKGHEDLFWVQNTGSAIPPEHLAHVFERYWQAKGGEKRGAGLGLPIVKGIVEAHGGRVWVESTEGRGTTFYFTIPIAAGAGKSRPALLH
jgi:signal transduction histidine kinase